MTVEWEGLDKFQRFLRDTPKVVRRDVEAALVQEGENIMGVSKSRTPVALGFLRAGGHAKDEVVPPPWVELSKTKRSVVEVVLAYAASYAVFAHEQEPRAGGQGQSKFLESAVKDAAKGFGGRMKRKILDRIGRRP